MKRAMQVARRMQRHYRAWRGRDIFYRPTIRIPLERHGSGYGGWMVRAKSLGESSVIYSFGLGEDITFDVSLAEQYGCQVHGFDPTPRAIEYVRRLQPPRFILHEYGLAAASGTGTLFLPRNQEHVSGSIIPASQLDDGGVVVVLKGLEDIRDELGHNAIDLLKMDIEGAEYQVLESLATGEPRIGQLLVEFHHRFEQFGVDATRRAVERVVGLGFELAWVSRSGEEFLFVHHSELDAESLDTRPDRASAV